MLRYPMSVEALETLARTDRHPAALARPGRGVRMARKLGGTTHPRPATASAAAELARSRLLTDSSVHAELAAALAGFADPLAHVDLDLALRRPAGTVRLHSWQRLHTTGVTAVTAAGDTVELAWWPDAHWAAELARTVTPAGPSTRAAAPTRRGTPAAYLRLPYELLLASGPAVREARAEVLAELLERHRGRVLGPHDRALTPASAAGQVVLLHTGEQGRLQVRVAGGRRREEERRQRRLGLVTWVLFDDGWRELAPAPAGEAAVVVRAVEPARLGGTIARLVEAVAA